MGVGELAHTVFVVLYTTVLVVVSIYGLHRCCLICLFYRHRRKGLQPAGRYERLPVVTIQLPMYNERLVAARIIEHTCRIDYPRELLQIQVLDDSTDDTSQVALAAVEEARRQGFDIEYIHRDDRSGFKAGALSNGLQTARGEFISIFDADFLPNPSFLHDSIHYFTDPRVCVVQTRWDHLNRDDSVLTRAQAIFLDGHFTIEHTARNRSDRFMSFNGTAGTWRRAAIQDAGGWRHDTLTEDLDLSYRAQLKGWKFVFLPDHKAPAELPPEMNAFRTQQFRWTKGGAQTAMKMLPRLLLSKAPLKIKIEGFFHLTAFAMHMLMLLMALLLGPAMLLRLIPLEQGTMWRAMFDMGVFSLATLSASVFYVASQVELLRDWRTAVKYLPVIMAIGIGLCVSNTRAILEAFMGRQSEFVRTPKYGSDAKQQSAGQGQARRKGDWVPYAEFSMGVYMSACAVGCMFSAKAAMTTPFLVMAAFGFFYVSVLSFQTRRAAAAREKPVRA